MCVCVCVCVCVGGGGGGVRGVSLGVVGGRGLGVIRLRVKYLVLWSKCMDLFSFTLLVWDQLSNQCPPPRSHTHLIPAERNVHL